MQAIVIPALQYFALVFGVGFALGGLRIFLFVPILGETLATLLEIPVMLAIAWFWCRFLMVRNRGLRESTSAIAMGGLALLLLLSAEVGLSMIVFDRTVTQHLMLYTHLPHQLGLAGQIMFAAFPFIQSRYPPDGE